MPGQVLPHDSAGEQKLVDQRVHSEAGFSLPAPAPRLAGHGSVDV
jgi:hypothetical protein